MTLPLLFGSQTSFRTVQAFLVESGYTTPAVTGRLGLRRIDDLSRPDPWELAKRESNLHIGDPLNALIRLFLSGHLSPAGEVNQFLPPGVLSAMEDLGLLRRRENAFYSPVLLVPLHDLFLAADRYVNPDGSPADAGSESIYLPVQRSAFDFIECLPNSPCDSFLDLGTGCGVAALWAARGFARHCWAIDITGRATHFAEFNRRINNLTNVTVMRGDLYQPVEGLTFDRICMHPPYGLTDSGYVYADGGEDGEALVRPAVQGARAHLSPGGIFLCWTTASDRRQASLEDRVRLMLAPDSHTFDVAVLVKESVDPKTYALVSSSTQRELPSWEDRFSRLEIERLVYGGILIQRHSRSGKAPFTVRRNLPPETDRGVLQWMTAWETAAAQPERNRLLLTAHPKASKRAELLVRHVFQEPETDLVEDGRMQPVDYRFRTSYPFQALVTCRSWLAYMVSRCNGRRSGADLYAEVAEHLPEQSRQDHFLQAMSALVSAGIVEIDGFRLPQEGSNGHADHSTPLPGSHVPA